LPDKPGTQNPIRCFASFNLSEPAPRARQGGKNVNIPAAFWHPNMPDFLGY
jgi:hypothetical protein